MWSYNDSGCHHMFLLYFSQLTCFVTCMYWILLNAFYNIISLLQSYYFQLVKNKQGCWQTKALATSNNSMIEHQVVIVRLWNVIHRYTKRYSKSHFCIPDKLHYRSYDPVILHFLIILVVIHCMSWTWKSTCTIRRYHQVHLFELQNRDNTTFIDVWIPIVKTKINWLL